METYKLYDGDVELTFSPAKHLYTVDGKKVQSITNVLQVINKPALMYWAVNMAVTHVESTLVPGVALDEIQIAGLLEGAKGAHRKTASDAAAIGTYVHDWVSKHLKGENPKMPTNAKIRAGVEAFLKFEKEHDFQVIESERKVYSRRFNIAGTADGYGTYEGEPVIFDLKTGSGIYAEALLQCGGYDLCLEEELDIEFKKHIVINCAKTGELSYHINDDPDRNMGAFLQALGLSRNLVEITKEIGK